MRESEMPATLRFTKREEKDLYNKCREINKILVNNENPPIKESELVHIILKEAIKAVKVNKSGEIYIDI